MQVFTKYLKHQSPTPQLPSRGHGWIIGIDGKLFHPSRSQADLLQALTTRKKVNTWQSKVQILCNLMRVNVS